MALPGLLGGDMEPGCGTVRTSPPLCHGHKAFLVLEMFRSCEEWGRKNLVPDMVGQSPSQVGRKLSASRLKLEEPDGVEIGQHLIENVRRELKK